MNKRELLNRITDIEREDFEIKKASAKLPMNIWEIVCAFANTAGGWIVLGVSQQGKTIEVTGLSNTEKIEQNFTTELRSKSKFNVLITPKCIKYDINGLTVLAFYIPSATQKPVFYNALTNTFIRTASGDQRATEAEINAMLRDQFFGVMSAKPVEKTSVNDLSKTTLCRYRDYMARFNPGLPYNILSDSEFLEKMQIADGNHLTYGGLLFMGNNLAINKTFSDFRIEFENPCAFPRSIDTLLKKDISIPRNPVLAKLFRNAKLADNAGYGFDKMLKWEKSTNTKVYFENSIDIALVVFRFLNQQKSTRKPAEF